MIEFMKLLALKAGEICQEAALNMSEVAVEYKNPKDLVTTIDRKVETFVRSEIKERFPGHIIVGEEGGTSGSGSDNRWLIDPIDGTASFVHGLPGYSISIAYQEDSITRAGVVYGPVLGQMFCAQKGSGAYLNGSPINVSSRNRMIESIWATGFACLRSGLEPNNLVTFNQILPLIRDFRRFGSAALDLAYVAAGKLDGFWEMNLNNYDVAAGVLLVEEAGGQVCDFSGTNHYPENGIVATNGLLTEPLLKLLKEVSNGG